MVGSCCIRGEAASGKELLARVNLRGLPGGCRGAGGVTCRGSGGKGLGLGCFGKYGMDDFPPPLFLRLSLTLIIGELGWESRVSAGEARV